jgi:acylphosphatase
MDEFLRVHLYVSGRVQGVWFRESTRRKAIELGVHGWVRNLPDGRVEATLEGPAAAVQRAVEFVREGPAHASVSRLDVVEEVLIPTASADPTPFRVR